MPLPTAGRLSLKDIINEIGLPANSSLEDCFNNANLSGFTANSRHPSPRSDWSKPWRMSEFYGYAHTPANVTVTVDSTLPFTNDFCSDNRDGGVTFTFHFSSTGLDFQYRIEQTNGYCSYNTYNSPVLQSTSLNQTITRQEFAPATFRLSVWLTSDPTNISIDYFQIGGELLWAIEIEHVRRVLSTTTSGNGEWEADIICNLAGTVNYRLFRDDYYNVNNGEYVEVEATTSVTVTAGQTITKIYTDLLPCRYYLSAWYSEDYYGNSLTRSWDFYGIPDTPDTTALNSATGWFNSDPGSFNAVQVSSLGTTYGNFRANYQGPLVSDAASIRSTFNTNSTGSYTLSFNRMILGDRLGGNYIRVKILDPTNTEIYNEQKTPVSGLTITAETVPLTINYPNSTYQIIIDIYNIRSTGHYFELWNFQWS